MDYVVGGVAALLSGNVTPNRPKLPRRALTPTKHQPSPNVTPKSEFVDDRSIFMSPTLQKKKAVLKKSPKRIFQNPDLDETNDGEGVSALTSPKADKVKKHLKSELEAENVTKDYPTSPKSLKKNKTKIEKASESPVHKNKSISSSGQEEIDLRGATETTPKKKKKKRNLSKDVNEIVSDKENAMEDSSPITETKQSSKKKRKLMTDINGTPEFKLDASDINDRNVAQKSKKKKINQANINVETKNENPDEQKFKKISKSMRRRERKKRTKLKIIKQQLRNLTDSEKALSKEKKSIDDEEKAIKTHNNKKNRSESQSNEDSDNNESEKEKRSPKIKKKSTKTKSKSDTENESVTENEQNNSKTSVDHEKRHKKPKSSRKQQIGNQNFNFDSDTNSKMEEETLNESEKKKKKLHKKQPINNQDSDSDSDSNSKTEQRIKNKKKKRSKVNPNAITDQNSDSEHESDDEIESENEQINKDFLETEPTEGASSSDEEKEEKGQKKPSNKRQTETTAEDDAEVIKRTLFVGNVPFSKKCKKEIKSIFSKYGHIDTVRIRTVPVKDGRVTPKLAVITQELHPERSTVNVYVKFTDPASVDKALSANNTVLNDHHLRVTRADDTGIHDTSRSVFVGNLPFAMEDDGLRSVFDRCGSIDSVRIVRDRATNAGKGFGYVNFVSKDGVELALSMSEEDLTVKNRIIRVKRCTQSQKGKQGNQQGKQGNYQGKERFQGNVQGNSGGNFRDKNQGDNFRGGRFQGGNFQGRNQGGNLQARIPGGNFQGRNQGGNFQGRNQGGNFQGRNPGGNFQARNQGNGFQGRNQGQGGNVQREKGRSQGDRQRQDDGQGDGAYRRIMNKRENVDSTDGPSPKVFKGDADQTVKEKKPRKVFVGMTAEKKKKHKVNKGLKRKKKLSEILTKV